jgi:hypothetical protein
VLQAEGDSVSVILNGEPVALRALRRDLYVGERADGEEVRVGLILDPTGPIRFIAVNGSLCGRLQVDPDYRPNPVAWKAYEGTFVSDLATGTVRVEGGRLLISVPQFPQAIPCTPLDDTRFVCPRGLIDFMVEPDGSVPAVRWGKGIVLVRVKDDPDKVARALGEGPK